MRVYFELEITATSEEVAKKLVEQALISQNVDIISYSETEPDEPEVEEEEEE